MGKTSSCLEHFPGVAGVDEAGRGSLAGPVVAAAVILPSYFDVTGLNDSKMLPPHVRQELSLRIRAEAIWSLSIYSSQEIDRHNILQATLMAMAEAVQKLAQKPDKVYIDGSHIPPKLLGSYELRAVKGGDRKIACIAAASILAKTERDHLMQLLAHDYPNYGFEHHMGYGTPQHLQAIEKHGPSPIHRQTFAPMKNRIHQTCLTYDA
jgi:ribonuclease HII